MVMKRGFLSPSPSFSDFTAPVKAAALRAVSMPALNHAVGREEKAAQASVPKRRKGCWRALLAKWRARR
jgi:hypothetical protein